MKETATKPYSAAFMTDAELEHARKFLTAALTVESALLPGWLADELVGACDEISIRSARQRTHFTPPTNLSGR